MIRATSNNAGGKLDQLKRKFAAIPPAAYKKFTSVTPIDTGRARASTDLKGTSIEANYPYANKLNEGYSRQATKGMTDPTIEFIRQQLRKK